MENPKQKIERAKRNKEIIKLYPDLTFRQIGKEKGISHERVRQIIKNSKIDRLIEEAQEK